MRHSGLHHFKSYFVLRQGSTNEREFTKMDENNRRDALYKKSIDLFVSRI